MTPEELEWRFPLEGLEHSMGCQRYPDACELCRAKAQRARVLRHVAVELQALLGTDTALYTPSDALTVLECLAAEYEGVTP